MADRFNFTLTQLEYIRAVHKYGHFAQAAEACHVTQPTLSMQIQKLEEDLGVVLFDRSKKPILLTEAGQKLIDQIQTVLHEAKKIGEIVEEGEGEELQGVLTVGVIPTIAPYLLPALLPVVERKFEGLDLSILELQTHRIIEALNNDEIDVGILATPVGAAKMFERALYYEPFSLLCRKGHPMSQMKRVKQSQLSSDDIWLLQEGHCLRNQVLDVCSLKPSPGSKRRFHFESGSLETLKNIVGRFGGYTLLPAMATAKLSNETILVPFERPIPAREVGLIYRREHYKIKLIEALEEAILQSIPEDIRKIRSRDLEVLPVEAPHR